MDAAAVTGAGEEQGADPEGGDDREQPQPRRDERERDGGAAVRRRHGRHVDTHYQTCPCHQ